VLLLEHARICVESRSIFYWVLVDRVISFLHATEASETIFGPFSQNKNEGGKKLHEEDNEFNVQSSVGPAYHIASEVVK